MKARWIRVQIEATFGKLTWNVLVVGHRVAVGEIYTPISGEPRICVCCPGELWTDVIKKLETNGFTWTHDEA